VTDVANSPAIDISKIAFPGAAAKALTTTA
jgi:hypothetical protein